MYSGVVVLRSVVVVGSANVVVGSSFCSNSGASADGETSANGSDDFVDVIVSLELN